MMVNKDARIMRRIAGIAVAACVVRGGVGLAVDSVGAQEQEILAATPPMGWNSWDSYGETVGEADIRSNAQWMAKHLKVYGWEYVVVDSGWYVKNHSAGTNAD